MSFEQQLEFVQALANPQYLAYLAQTGQLEDVRLLNYLDHLRGIWSSNQAYAKFISYPASLHHLDLLKSVEFRKALIHTELVNKLTSELLEKWHKESGSSEAITIKAEPAPTES